MRIKSLFLLLFLISSVSEVAAMDMPKRPNKVKPEILRVWGDSINPNKFKKVTTGRSPAKGNLLVVGAQSPMGKLLKPCATLTYKDAIVIDSELLDFSEGRFSYISIFHVRSSIGLNAGDNKWDLLTEEFLKWRPWREGLQDDFDDEEFENFLIDLSHFIKENLAKIDVLTTHEDPGEIVCRHHAIYAAVLFSKIIKRANTAHSGWMPTIQIVKAMKFDHLWHMHGGHAWNLVSVSHQGNTCRWYYDAHNFSLVRIKDDEAAEQHRMLRFSDPEEVVEEDIDLEFTFDWFKYTLERYIDKSGEDSLYNPINQSILKAICGNVLVNKCPTRVTQKVVALKKPVPKSPLAEKNSRKGKRPLEKNMDERNVRRKLFQ